MLRSLSKVGQICITQLKASNGKSSLMTAMAQHVKARCETYPRDNIKRFHVPDDKVSWETDFPGYSPTEYTSKSLIGTLEKPRPEYSDPDPKHSPVEFEKLKFNDLDGDLNRCSHVTDVYEIKDGYPVNPMGRTGLKGRGCLGRWGPNHAADPIVTRWERDKDGKIKKDENGKGILQFVCIKRKDNGEWAIPGGMVNAGEIVTVTLRREFGEEALNTLEMSSEEKEATLVSIEECFKHGKEVYKGYVDDPRNTDNAWMETVAYNFHDEAGDSLGKLKLHAGDDAVGVQWMSIHKGLKLYASHHDFIKEVVEMHGASW
ncbi:hypothetical protein CHS0354_003716 [Potamilus streckersoni]|uniref:Nudix hydrolase domain-containing protein n=1 Tax=Potamilus streckersoni TaxID=2493646 RepID=A0AAE0W0R9_9BIVA|nr:hypothetical protein CHS0354_003716 [Potamilus streckersoni]